jgi:hypothetical protein
MCPKFVNNNKNKSKEVLKEDKKKKGVRKNKSKKTLKKEKKERKEEKEFLTEKERNKLVEVTVRQNNSWANDLKNNFFCTDRRICLDCGKIWNSPNKSKCFKCDSFHCIYPIITKVNFIGSDGYFPNIRIFVAEERGFTCPHCSKTLPISLTDGDIHICSNCNFYLGECVREN